jgi:hypothetical protein
LGNNEWVFTLSPISSAVALPFGSDRSPMTTRVEAQGLLRRDVVMADIPMIELMVGAVTEHTGQTEL